MWLQVSMPAVGMLAMAACEFASRTNGPGWCPVRLVRCLQVLNGGRMSVMYHQSLTLAHCAGSTGWCAYYLVNDAGGQRLAVACGPAAARPATRLDCVGSVSSLVLPPVVASHDAPG